MRAMLLVLATVASLAGCTRANGAPPASDAQRAGAPGIITISEKLRLAVGDTLGPGPISWGAAARATGYSWVVSAATTNGTWTAFFGATGPFPLPASGSAAATSFTTRLAAMPWDSVTFTVVVQSVDAIGPTGKTSSATWTVRRRATAPGAVTVDTILKTGLISPVPIPVATLVFPAAVNLTLGQNRVQCAFQQFSAGEVTQWTADKPMCDSIYQRTIPLAARTAVTPSQQAHTDSLPMTCVTWATSNPLAVGLTPRAPCSAAVTVAGLGITLRAQPDMTLFRYVSGDDTSPVLTVSAMGLVTCLRPGISYVTATAANGVRQSTSVVCNRSVLGVLAVR